MANMRRTDSSPDLKTSFRKLIRLTHDPRAFPARSRGWLFPTGVLRLSTGGLGEESRRLRSGLVSGACIRGLYGPPAQPQHANPDRAEELFSAEIPDGITREVYVGAVLGTPRQ